MSTIASVIERTALFCFILFESIYLKSIYSGPKLKATTHTICVMYLDYILLLLVCGGCPLRVSTQYILESADSKWTYAAYKKKQNIIQVHNTDRVSCSF